MNPKSDIARRYLDGLNVAGHGVKGYERAGTIECGGYFHDLSSRLRHRQLELQTRRTILDVEAVLYVEGVDIGRMLWLHRTAVLGLLEFRSPWRIGFRQ